MQVTVTHEALVFAVMAALGAALGMLFDIERALRAGLNGGSILTHITDFLFWIAAGTVSIYLVIHFNDGVLRFYELTGVILGAVLYFCTVSVYIKKLFTAVFKILHKFIRLIFKIVLTPLTFLYKILIGAFNALRILHMNKGKRENGEKEKEKNNEA